MRFVFGLGLFTIFMSLGCNGGGGGGGKSNSPSSTTPASTTPPPVGTTPVVPLPPAGNAPGNFTVGPSLVKPRGLHTATLLPDGRVLIVGGLDAAAGNPAFVTENEVYDPTANTFTLTSSLGGSPGGYMTSSATNKPVPRYLHTATLLADGRVLICGGYGVESMDAGGNPVQSDLASAFTFSPTTNTFAAVGNMGMPREAPAAVLLPGGQVAVMGGLVASLNNNQGGTTAAAEIFDPTANTFSPIGNMLNDRQAPGVLAGGQALVVGGLSLSVPAGQTQVQSFLVPGSDALSTSTGMFAQGPSPAIDRIGHSLNVIGADVIMAGGSGQSGDVLQVERLTNGTWTTVAQLSGPRESHGADSSGTRVLLAGGVFYDSTGTTMTTLATADLFDGSANTVKPLKLAHQRNGCAVTALATSHFLVTGGYENGKTDPLGLDGTSVAPTEISNP